MTAMFSESSLIIPIGTHHVDFPVLKSLSDMKAIRACASTTTTSGVRPKTTTLANL